MTVRRVRTPPPSCNPGDLTPKSFDVETNRRFWTSNASEGEYQGSVNADLLLFLTQKYLGEHVLDAGAGDGTLVRSVRNAADGSEVRGVDLVPKNDDVEQGDLTQLVYGDSTFDTLFCSEVIEHMMPVDTQKTLAELTRVLKPGGRLILTTPLDERLSEKMIHCPHCENDFHRWGHQQSFVENDFRGLAIEHGLEVVELFAIRYSRLRRFRFLGTGICGSRWFKNWMRRANGKRHLVLVAEKQASASPNVPMKPAA